MKSYYDSDQHSCIDVSPVDKEWVESLSKDFTLPHEVLTTQVYCINRVFVPEKNRGKHIGSKLLKQVTDAADKNKVILMLWINPYGGMTYTQLEDWYIRYGFTRYYSHQYGGHIYIRMPK